LQAWPLDGVTPHYSRVDWRAMQGCLQGYADD
jgi:hypothetical protein